LQVLISSEKITPAKKNARQIGKKKFKKKDRKKRSRWKKA